MMVSQINDNKKLHVLWPLKYCTKVGANLFLLTCKISQGSKILSNGKTIITQFTSDDIVLDHLIKTHVSLV